MRFLDDGEESVDRPRLGSPEVADFGLDSCSQHHMANGSGSDDLRGIDPDYGPGGAHDALEETATDQDGIRPCHG